MLVRDPVNGSKSICTSGIAAFFLICSANSATVQATRVRVVGDSVARNVSFEAGWHWLTAAPTALAAGKWAYLTLESHGPNATDTAAAWVVES